MQSRFSMRLKALCDVTLKRAPVMVFLSLLCLGAVCGPVSAQWDWRFETVDSEGDVGKHSSIALDMHGYPHISYYDGTNGDLKYARRDADGWHLVTVDSQGDVGRYTSLALDADGHPHISYYDVTNTDLKYASLDATGWHIEGLDADGDVGSFSSLAVDSQGQPHISYVDVTNLALKYAHLTDTGWLIEVADSLGDGGNDIRFPTSIALDADDLPHVTYAGYYWKPCQYCYGYIVYYARKQRSTNWTSERIVTAWRRGPVLSALALDRSSDPHIVVSISGIRSGSTYFYRPDDGDWQSERAGRSGYISNLVLDGEGQPHYASAGYPGVLLYSSRVDSEWRVENLAEHASYASLSLGGIEPHISFYGGDADLQYVWASAFASSVSAGPDPFCPGWSLYYTLRLANIGDVSLTSVLVTDTLPTYVCCPQDGPGSGAPGVWDEQANTMTWHLGALSPGDTTRIELVVHSYSSLRTGTVISNTFRYTARQRPRIGEETAALVADASICPATPTVMPTSTSTPSPTPTSMPTLTATPARTPTPRGLVLPLILR